jgi:hypothetical protein
MLVATAFNLCAVSVDRLVAVKWPALRYPTIMTPTTTWMIIISVWFSSIVFGIPMLCFDNEKMACIYWLFVSVLKLFIPFVVILYSYTAILKIAKEMQNHIAPQIEMA